MDESAIGPLRGRVSPLAMLTQSFEIGNDVGQLTVGNPLLRKGGHGAEPMSHLKPNEETRQWLVIDRWPQTRLAARMTLRTLLHEDPLSPTLLVVKCQWAGHGFAAPAR